VGCREQKRESFEIYMLEHRKISGVYWSLASLHMMDCLDDLPKEEIIEWVFKTYDKDSGMLTTIRLISS